ncbi:glycosyltransferase [Stakelama sediminis]|uniref:Glycosyltransferase involved in cell wall biosynthesis n=1 Tax=Stakelama sediminis TaxID=463200 RepID=A0A840YV96_9SPHN|nr:glycosyltransferase [Stakelama sediminis]MBB5717568.1 glycosyltransferase involved in cell wall biosynthesis [Stakelama sediminis]
MTKRIAIFFPSLTAGGAEKSALFIGTILAEKGYTVDMVVARCRGGLQDDPFISAHLVDLHRDDPMLALDRYLGYLRRTRPDLVISLVHSANFISGVGMRFFPDIPVIVSVHNTLIKRPKDQWWIRRWFGHAPERFLYRRARFVQTVSDQLADQCETLFSVPRERLYVTYNSASGPGTSGIDDPDEADPTAEIEAASPYILSAGRLVEIKGFDTLIAAFARADIPANWKLVILGDGPLRPKLERQIERLGMSRRIILGGFRKSLNTWMDHARGFVFATRGEGFGLVVHEALLAHLPVVTSRVPGVSELVGQGRFGRLVEPEDIAGFARAIEDIAENRLTAPVSAAFEEHLDRFTPEAVAGRYLEMVEAAIGAP